jgi:hypothetical protein
MGEASRRKKLGLTFKERAEEDWEDYVHPLEGKPVKTNEELAELARTIHQIKKGEMLCPATKFAPSR